jgi:hypothetical protein
MNSDSPRRARATARRFDPKSHLEPALMAIAMSLVMSLVEAITKHRLAPKLVSAWLASFALAVAVAVPTAILLAPRVQRLVGHLTGAPRHLPTAATRDQP